MFSIYTVCNLCNNIVVKLPHKKYQIFKVFDLDHCGWNQPYKSNNIFEKIIKKIFSPDFSKFSTWTTVVEEELPQYFADKAVEEEADKILAEVDQIFFTWMKCFLENFKLGGLMDRWIDGLMDWWIDG